MTTNTFDSTRWIEEKRLELINLMFKNEFDIHDFRNTSKVINFDDLQTELIRDRINQYRPAMSALFKAEEIRSVLDYYFLQQDKKPVLNLLKQILKYYQYEFTRTSEYQGNYGGKKVYKSRYTISPIKKPVTTSSPNESPNIRVQLLPHTNQIDQRDIQIGATIDHTSLLIDRTDDSSRQIKKRLSLNQQNR